MSISIVVISPANSSSLRTLQQETLFFSVSQWYTDAITPVGTNDFRAPECSMHVTAKTTSSCVLNHHNPVASNSCVAIRWSAASLSLTGRDKELWGQGLHARQVGAGCENPTAWQHRNRITSTPWSCRCMQRIM